MRITALLALLAIPCLIHADATPLGKLQFRDHAIVMSSRGGETRYTVFDAEGTLLDEVLTLDEVLARHPELHSLLESAVAGGVIWAGNETTRVDGVGFPSGLESYRGDD